MVSMSAMIAVVLTFSVSDTVAGADELPIEGLNQTHSDYAEAEFEAYVKAALRIQDVQQETQRNMWQAAINEGIGLNVYYEILQSVPEGSRTDQSGAFKKTNALIDTLESEMIDSFIEIIEGEDLKIERFYEIWSAREDEDIRLELSRIYSMKQNKTGRESGIAGYGSIESMEDKTGRKYGFWSDNPEVYYHFIMPGDTLWDLAELYLGDPLQWPVLVEYNKDWLISPMLVQVGRFAVIPANDMLITDTIPEMTLSEKRILLVDLFGLEDFRFNSFAYISQQQELRTRLEVHTSVESIQKQIQENEKFKNRLVDAPDLMSSLIPLMENGQDETVNESSEVALDNMLIDETHSPFGSDFYDEFSNRWEFPGKSVGFHVRIIERPVPGRGSQMIMEVNQEIVYQFQLQPGYEQIVELARAASNGLSNYLINYEKNSAKYF